MPLASHPLSFSLSLCLLPISFPPSPLSLTMHIHLNIRVHTCACFKISVSSSPLSLSISILSDTLHRSVAPSLPSFPLRVSLATTQPVTIQGLSPDRTSRLSLDRTCTTSSATGEVLAAIGYSCRQQHIKFYLTAQAAGLCDVRQCQNNSRFQHQIFGLRYIILRFSVRATATASEGQVRNSAHTHV